MNPQRFKTVRVRDSKTMYPSIFRHCQLIALLFFVLVMSLTTYSSAALPPGWVNQDIGTTGGSANEVGDTWTIRGDGADIWGSPDAFHYAFTHLSGDVQIVARVVSVGTILNAWSKGGVMIRETLDANSKHAMMIITGGAGSGAAFQWREVTGGSPGTVHDVPPVVVPPIWIKIVREGDVFSAFRSLDGLMWTPQASIIIPMTSEVYVGLCVTSHYAGRIQTYTFDNVKVGRLGFASMPNPANDSLYSDTWVILSWQAGDFAVSHDIYFGENFEDVDNGTGNTFQGNQTLTNFNVGIAGFPYSDGLEPNVTYYWRIDEVEADGTIHKGDIWSFTTVPQKATNPFPVDGAKFVDYSITLSWIPGFGGILHDIYFGDNFDDVNDGTGGTFRGYTNDTQYDVGFFNTPYPQGLAPGRNYYWRIDEIEIDGQTTHKGDVWNFSTAGAGGGLKGQYYMGMNFNTLFLTRIDPQVNFNWGSSEPGPGIGYDQFSVRWTGEVKAAFTETYRFYTNSDDGVRLWIGDQLLIDNWTDHGATVNVGSIDLVAGNKYSLIMEMYENGGDAVAELSWSSPSTPKQFIPQAALAVSFSANAPSPADGATEVRNNPILSWASGGGASQHDVYLGTNFGDVNDVDIFDNTGIYRGRWVDAIYNPEKLEVGQTYFWRIDEYNTDGTIDKGKVWRFTVGDVFEETVEYQVSVTEDDRYAANTNLQNLDSAYLAVGSSSFNDVPYYASGMVFRNVNIPQGAEIVSAYLRIQSYNSRLSDVVYGKIQAEAADDAVVLSAFRNVGTLPKTNASVDWDLNEPWTADTWYTSPDIAGVVQEVIDRGGWSEGNSLAIIYSTRLRDGGYRYISSFDRGSDYAPILEITYIP